MTAITAKRTGMIRDAAIRGFVDAIRRGATCSKELRDVEHRIRIERRRIEDWAWVFGPPESEELARLKAMRARLEGLEELWSLCAETARARAIEFGATSRDWDEALNQDIGIGKAVVVPLQGR